MVWAFPYKRRKQWGCPFVSKFRKFPVPFGIFTPVWIGPSSFSREKLQDGGESFESTLHTLDAKWSAIVRACSWSKTKSLKSDVLENIWTGCSEFPVVSSPGLHPITVTLPREKFLSFSHKYQRKVEFWMRVKVLHMKQLNTAFCQVILGGKCAQAGIERDRSGLVENTVPQWTLVYRHGYIHGNLHSCFHGQLALLRRRQWKRRIQRELFWNRTSQTSLP